MTNEAEAPRTCTRCGQAAIPGARFCSACGAEFSEPAAVAASRTSAATKTAFSPPREPDRSALGITPERDADMTRRSGTPLLVGIVVAALLIGTMGLAVTRDAQLPFGTGGTSWSFSSGLVTVPVDGATDGRDVLGSFFLYLAQGDMDRAMQYVVPEKRDWMRHQLLVERPWELGATRAHVASNNGVLIGDLWKEFVVVNERGGLVSENGRLLTRTSPRKGEVYSLGSVNVRGGWGATEMTGLFPLMTLTDEGWRIAGFLLWR